MPTIGEKLARRIIHEVRKQKRPRVYCVIEYFNPVFDKTSHAYCDNEAEYEGLVRGLPASSVKLLWSSKRFRKAREGRLSPRQRRAKKLRAWFYGEFLDNL